MITYSLNEYIKYGWSSDFKTGTTLPNTATFNNKSNGIFTTNNLTAIYLFLPAITFKDDNNNITIKRSILEYDKSSFFVKELEYIQKGSFTRHVETIHSDWTGREYLIVPIVYEGKKYKECSYGYYIYKIQLLPNINTLRVRDFKISTFKEIIGNALLYNDALTNTEIVQVDTITLTFILLGNYVEGVDLDINDYIKDLDSLNHYKISTDTINTSIIDEDYIGISEKKNHDLIVFEYNNTNTYYLALYCSMYELYLALTTTEDEEHSPFTIELYSYTKINNRALRIYSITIDLNTNKSPRIETIRILNTNSNTILTISLYLKYLGEVDSTEEYSTESYLDTLKNKYWENDSPKVVKLIDINLGLIVDSTSLLYKGGNANIYKTLQLKDNTLFLGNYLRLYNTDDYSNILNSGINNNLINITEIHDKIYIKKKQDKSDYDYIPDMISNSLKKKLFKKGEYYLLGLVFINSKGAKSSVHYLGDYLNKGIFKPTIEPKVLEDDITKLCYYKKSVAMCSLSSSLSTLLANKDVIAVVPVYAKKLTHNVLCLGFLSACVSNTKRETSENVKYQYSWFYRGDNSRDLKTLNIGDGTIITNPINAAESGSFMKYLIENSIYSIDNIEIQNLIVDNDNTTNNRWEITNNVFSINSPEIECDTELTESMMEDFSWKFLYDNSTVIYNNNINIRFDNSYPYSDTDLTNPYFKLSNEFSVSSITDHRFISGGLWKGFLNPGYSSASSIDGATVSQLYNNVNYYFNFMVYPWQRKTIGGEGPESNYYKKHFNLLYFSDLGNSESSNNSIKNNVKDFFIFRDYDDSSLKKIDNKYYQGNVDTILATSNSYYTTLATNTNLALNGVFYTPVAHGKEGIFSGYNTTGKIKDPIPMKYKSAPHIVMLLKEAEVLNGNINGKDTLHYVELFHPITTDNTYTSMLDLLSYQWLKCGDLVRVKKGEETRIFFEEGDYFYGRYDSLRTYAYTNEDINSVIEIVSGMVCSRVNLDSRFDRNRGGTSPFINPTNFNRFNNVYNLFNNYFTFSYIDLNNLNNNRDFVNSILWSLTKLYGADVDEWCNIQDANTLDLDGDKGELLSLNKLGNDIIAFLNSGIALIQYNDKTSVAVTLGVPIEIANSGKVNGKYYLYNNIGCLNRNTITSSPNGIYFVDYLNKALYRLGLKGDLVDLGTTYGMKSWETIFSDLLKYSYYDKCSLEVLFTSPYYSLAFDDTYSKFNAFLGYGDIRWNFGIGKYTVLIIPPNFNLVLTYEDNLTNFASNLGRTSIQHTNEYNLFWKKNSIDKLNLFGNATSLEISLICNPESSIDKTFTNIEYRADGFQKNGTYIPDYTFNKVRVWNEYLDTGIFKLTTIGKSLDGLTESIRHSSNLKKKFRNWNILIPRSMSSKIIYANIKDVEPFDRSISLDGGEANIDVDSQIYSSRDRIRNPWCRINLSMETNDVKDLNNIIIHDITVKYFK